MKTSIIHKSYIPSGKTTVNIKILFFSCSSSGFHTNELFVNYRTDLWYILNTMNVPASFQRTRQHQSSAWMSILLFREGPSTTWHIFPRSRVSKRLPVWFNGDETPKIWTTFRNFSFVTSCSENRMIDSKPKSEGWDMLEYWDTRKHTHSLPCIQKSERKTLNSWWGVYIKRT